MIESLKDYAENWKPHDIFARRTAKESLAQSNGMHTDIYIAGPEEIATHRCFREFSKKHDLGSLMRHTYPLPSGRGRLH